MGRYVKTSKDKNNKLISLRVDDDKLLEKYKTILTKIEDYIENVELNTLPVYDNRYIKTKIKTCCDKINTNFSGLNVSEDGVECESFTFFLLILYLLMRTSIT